jgi:hypothetical protein
LHIEISGAQDGFTDGLTYIILFSWSGGKIYHIRDTENSIPARALFHEKCWMGSKLEGPFSYQAAIIPNIEAAET